jgi:hypothetical protein
MKLKDVVNKSIYATTGHISGKDSLPVIESYILYNLEQLRQFKGILVVSNYKKIDKELETLIEELWNKYLQDCKFIHNGVSKGRDFGAAENDNSAFDYCKESNIEWLCKSANDIILTGEVLEIEVEDSDFYYFNGVGLGGIMHGHGGDLEDTFKNAFFPQTNFYFINVSKCDYLNSKSHIDEIYQKTISDPNYKGIPYDYGFSACEEQLKHCVYRNNLKKCRLVDDDKYMDLLRCVVAYQIHDPSHKNVMINGVCHYHYPGVDILEV